MIYDKCILIKKAYDKIQNLDLLFFYEFYILELKKNFNKISENHHLRNILKLS